MAIRKQKCLLYISPTNAMTASHIRALHCSWYTEGCCTLATSSMHVSHACMLGVANVQQPSVYQLQCRARMCDAVIAFVGEIYRRHFCHDYCS